MRRTPALAALALVALAAASACTAIRDAASPVCTGEHVDALVLVAQSVPTADRVPCIRGYPAGWNLAKVQVRSGQTSFTLDSDRGGISALRVTLQARCDVTGATQVPTDEAGTMRYERILSVDAGFRAVRSYRFPGGCVTYRFQFGRRGQALVNEASVAVGFVSRTRIDARLRHESDGKVHL